VCILYAVIREDLLSANRSKFRYKKDFYLPSRSGYHSSSLSTRNYLGENSNKERTDKSTHQSELK
jgi:hypothetical protein